MLPAMIFGVLVAVSRVATSLAGSEGWSRIAAAGMRVFVAGSVG